MVFFWTTLTLIALIWYIITVFIVGINGYKDLKHMLSVINEKNNKK